MTGEKCIAASLSELLVVNPSYYCLGLGILIRFFINGVSTYCSCATVNAVFTQTELLFWQINKYALCVHLCHKRISCQTSVSSLYLEIQYNVYKRCLVYAIWRQMEKKHCIALDIQLRAEVIIIHAMQEDKFCC